MDLESELASLRKQKSLIEQRIAEILSQQLAIKNKTAHDKIVEVFGNPANYDTKKIRSHFLQNDTEFNDAGFYYTSFYVDDNTIRATKNINKGGVFSDNVIYSINDLIIELKKLYDNGKTKFNSFIDNNRYEKDGQNGGRKNAL
jgi:predicted metal-binding protein